MNIIKLDSINSTNTYCKEYLANQSASLPVAVIAKEQSAGRGRYGKNFYSPTGGIYLSYAYEGKYEEADLMKITVVTASIVHKVLQQYCQNELSIKWINDIYLGSRKTAGILTERVDIPTSDSYYLIIGIGINVSPSEVPEELTKIVGFLLDDSDKANDAIDAITDDLLSSLDRILGECRTESFAKLIDYYKDNCIELPADFGNKLFAE